MKKFIKLFISLFLLLNFSIPISLWASESEVIVAPTEVLTSSKTHIYMLAEPIEQSTKLTKAWALATFGVDTLYEGGKAFIIYSLSGNPHVAGVAAIHGAIAEVPVYAANTRAQLQLRAWWQRKKDLQKIANIPGVKDIQVFTASSVENMGIAKATLHSNSMVFVETDGSIPAAVGNKEWIPIENLDNAKIQLNLQIDKEAIGSKIEIPLKDFFQGTKLDAEAKQEWIEKLEKWKKTLSFTDRHISKKSFNKLVAISGTLFVDGKEIEIKGNFAAGSAVNKVLGTTLLQKVTSMVRKFFALDSVSGKMLTTNKSLVIEPDEAKTGCVAFFQKFAGKVYVREH